MPAPIVSAPGTIVRSFHSSNGRTVLADAQLAVEDRPAALEPDGQRGERKQGEVMTSSAAASTTSRTRLTAGYRSRRT